MSWRRHKFNVIQIIEHTTHHIRGWSCHAHACTRSIREKVRRWLWEWRFTEITSSLAFFELICSSKWIFCPVIVKSSCACWNILVCWSLILFEYPFKAVWLLLFWNFRWSTGSASKRIWRRSTWDTCYRRRWWKWIRWLSLSILFGFFRRTSWCHSWHWLLSHRSARSFALSKQWYRKVISVVIESLVWLWRVNLILFFLYRLSHWPTRGEILLFLWRWSLSWCAHSRSSCKCRGRWLIREWILEDIFNVFVFHRRWHWCLTLHRLCLLRRDAFVSLSTWDLLIRIGVWIWILLGKLIILLASRFSLSDFILLTRDLSNLYSSWQAKSLDFYFSIHIRHADILIFAYV